MKYQLSIKSSEEKSSAPSVRQGDQRNSEQMDEQGGSNWPKFEDADWPAGGEDKPSGWAFRTKRQDSHPNLKPPYVRRNPTESSGCSLVKANHEIEYFQQIPARSNK